MNKKIAAITVGAVVAVLPVSGCANEAYWYAISGTVEAGQIDYDCPASRSMEGAAFAVGTSQPKMATNRAPAKPNSGTHSGKKTAPPKPLAPSAAPSRTSGATLTKETGGVKLTKKPDKPELIYRVPAVKHSKAQKGCTVEYELFVRNDDGLFEQGVRQADYDKCLDQKLESFPACTEG